jgi:carbon-monoxide dehydrogenase small subunit|tara:strand:+ start:244 stop:396 length:153 start_codon:yes stop_codon:yes gene_type:complete
MTIEPMLEELANMTAPEIAEALSGNLCRCTGYQGIIDAVLAAVARDSSTV